jgi:nucleotide-binding universal stress UspA family protein
MGVFERIVCGVDGSPESLEAVRQCDVLLRPGGSLLLVAAVDPLQAVHFQVAPSPVHAARHAFEDLDRLEEAALAALERARAEATHAQDVAILQADGAPAPCLLEAAAAERATLVAVGTHGLGRAAGILLGSVATRVLDGAPCSVLLARRRDSEEAWLPRRIVVAADGSPEADAALEAGRELESRLGAELRSVTLPDERPAHALVAAAADADLVALGAEPTGRRRLRGLAGHVAHDAPCSVLAVRAAVPAVQPAA